MVCMIFLQHEHKTRKSKRYSYLEKENEGKTFHPVDAHVVDSAACIVDSTAAYVRTQRCNERKTFCPIDAHVVDSAAAYAAASHALEHICVC